MVCEQCALDLQVEEGMQWLDDCFHLIRCQDDELPSIDWVLDLARAAVLRCACLVQTYQRPCRSGHSWSCAHYVFDVIISNAMHLDLRRQRSAIRTLSWVGAMCRYGIRGLVIDPYNELDHQRPGAMSETEYVSQMLTKIKRFAQHHDVHVW